MGRRIVLSDRRIVAPTHNLPVANYHSAHRHLAGLLRLLSQRNGFTHKDGVEFSSAHRSLPHDWGGFERPAAKCRP